MSSGANLKSRDANALPSALKMLKKGIDDNIKQRRRQNRTLLHPTGQRDSGRYSYDLQSSQHCRSLSTNL